MRKLETQIYEIKKPIMIYCVAVKSFPADVPLAYKKLHQLAPEDPKRRYFGISWGGQTITYKAGATEIKEGELNQKGLEKFEIRKGKYLAVLLDDINKIGETIQELIKDPRIDKDGYCVEMYLDENKVRCMVTMKGSD